MPDPATISAVAGGVASVAQGLGTAFGGGDDGAIKLPRGMEERQIQIMLNTLKDYESRRRQALDISNLLYNRGRLEADVASGLMPAKDAFAKITRQNEDIAKMYGSAILKQVSSLTDPGFENSLRYKAKVLSESSGEEFKDPAVDRQITEGRQKLEAELAKRLGPGFATSSAGQRALQMYEQGAIELRSKSSRDYRQQQLGELSTLTEINNADRAGIGTLLGQRAAVTGELKAGMSAGNNAYDVLLSAQKSGQDALQLGSVPFSQMQSFGTQNLTDETSIHLDGGRYKGFGPTNASTRDYYLKNRGSGIGQNSTAARLGSPMIRPGTFAEVLRTTR